MNGLVEWLAADPERCTHGYHRTMQVCPDCGAGGDWAIFRDALARATRLGLVHQRDMRPLLRGRIEPKHVGLCYRRAIREGLIREVTRERSNDEAGRNTNKWEPVYEVAA